MRWCGCPSSINEFSQKPSCELTPIFVERQLSTISPDNFVFKNFGFLNFYYELFAISLTIHAMGIKNSKMLLLLQLQFFFNQTFSTYFLWQSSQNLFIGILKTLKFSLTWEPMAVKISNHYSSYSFDSFSTKLFLNVPCNSPHKTCFLEFWNLNKKRLKFNIVANGKMKNCQYLGNGQP